ncbi:MAG: protoheme IX farnesyltransferase [SAR324 cluster bacterium]|nr:protoheme IX farnesyltransferase [SAR324 cluster bacterium]
MKNKAMVANDIISMTYSKSVSYLALTKPRLLMLVVMTTLVGFLLAVRQDHQWLLMFHLLLGTTLLGGGANSLNQWYEWAQDSRMRRTAERPIPSGKLSREQAWLFGVTISVTGLLYLAMAVNSLTALLGFLSWGIYLFWYTPLKQKSVLNTWIGAITGALPPVMGWTAVENSMGTIALCSFGILYFWQLPHFFAISWLCRDDYQKGGFKMLSMGDNEGSATAQQMLLNTLPLIVFSIIPYMTGFCGDSYMLTSIILGGIFLFGVGRFYYFRDNISARWVFIISIIYLPILLSVMVVDRMPILT